MTIKKVADKIAHDWYSGDEEHLSNTIKSLSSFIVTYFNLYYKKENK